jgi:hypothetical protein
MYNVNVTAAMYVECISFAQYFKSINLFSVLETLGLFSLHHIKYANSFLLWPQYFKEVSYFLHPNENSQF